MCFFSKFSAGGLCGWGILLVISLKFQGNKASTVFYDTALANHQKDECPTFGGPPYLPFFLAPLRPSFRRITLTEKAQYALPFGGAPPGKRFHLDLTCAV